MTDLRPESRPRGLRAIFLRFLDYTALAAALLGGVC